MDEEQAQVYEITVEGAAHMIDEQWVDVSVLKDPALKAAAEAAYKAHDAWKNAARTLQNEAERVWEEEE